MASGAEAFATVWVSVHKGIARFIWLHTMIYMMTALLSVLSSPHTRSTTQISHIIKLRLADILLWLNTRNSHFKPYKGWKISNNKIFCSFFADLAVEHQILYPCWSLGTYWWICPQICGMQSVFNKCLLYGKRRWVVLIWSQLDRIFF